jgi:hypothetical protein
MMADVLPREKMDAIKAAPTVCGLGTARRPI